MYAPLVFNCAFAVISMANGDPEHRQTLEPSQTVYVHFLFSGRDMLPICARAEHVACRMFAKVGVRINFHLGQPEVNDRQQPIIILLTSDTPSAFKPHALAYTYEGVHIRVFYDRVSDLTSPNRTATIMLLAHVMVHEITHVLGVNNHEADGIMKACWTKTDIRQMANMSPLPFTPVDINMIRDGVARRRQLAVKNEDGAISETLFVPH
jgi:hypothetical protein